MLDACGAPTSHFVLYHLSNSLETTSSKCQATVTGLGNLASAKIRLEVWLTVSWKTKVNLYNAGFDAFVAGIEATEETENEPQLKRS